MADALIKVAEPAVADKNVDTESLVGVGGATVQRERVEIAGAALAEIAAVKNAAPSTEYGLVTRNIPSGVQPVSDNAGSLTTDTLQLPAALVGGRLDVNIGAAGTAVPVTDNAGSLTVDGAVTVSGDVTAGSADSGNPVKVGGIAKSGLPTVLSDAQRSNLLTDLYGRPRVLIERKKLLGHYKAESGRLTVLASAHGATAGFFWLINPVSSGIVVTIKKVMAMALPTAVTAFASTPRITIERVTFTGTASGATITPAKRDSTDAANVATVRTASTGLTLTGGAIVTSFFVPPVLTAVGVAVPAEQYLYDSTDEDDYVVLRAGEGLVCRQADNGTTSDTRVAVLAFSWEES